MPNKKQKERLRKKPHAGVLYWASLVLTILIILYSIVVFLILIASTDSLEDPSMLSVWIIIAAIMILVYPILIWSMFKLNKLPIIILSLVAFSSLINMNLIQLVLVVGIILAYNYSLRAVTDKGASKAT
ncbi:MAG: hypothetical protein V1853_00770 [bacterium]